MGDSLPKNFDLSSLQSSDELVSALELLDEMERRKMEAPLLNYQPHPKARKFHSRSWKKRRAVVAGANKTGKTWMGGYEALAHMYGYRFWEVPGLRLKSGDLPPRESVDPKYWVRNGEGVPIQVPNKGMIVTGLKMMQGIGEVIWPVLESALPVTVRSNPAFRVVKGPQGVPVLLRLPNGSEAILASAEQDDISFEGTKLQWAWFDEPTRASVYNAVWRGLAMDFGHIWFTLTPLGARCLWLKLDVVDSEDPDVFFEQVDITDNPYFAEEARRQFIENGNWGDAEKNARLHGEWEAVGGRVIHNFDRKVHVVPAQALPRSWLSGMTIDPHHVRPPYICWWKISDWGVYHFYKEYPAGDFSKMRSGGKPITELANAIRSIEGPEPAKFRICDPRFGKSELTIHGQKHSAWADQMREVGLFFDSRVPDTHLVEIGEQKIIEMLRYSKEHPIGPTNTPRLIFHDSCPNLIRALERYGLKFNKDPTSLKEVPSEEWKDPIDALRYTVLMPINPLEREDLTWDSNDDLWKENQE